MNPGVCWIGSQKWPPIAGCGPAVVKYKSAIKVDKKTSDGKNDAVTTVKGTEQGEIDITVTWKEDAGDIEAAVAAYLLSISPRGPNGGTPQEWVHDDAAQHNVGSVLVETMETERTPGAGVATAKLHGSSWAKPKAVGTGQGAGKTPNDASQWVDTGNAGMRAAGVHFDVPANEDPTNPGNSGFQGPNAPKVKP